VTKVAENGYATLPLVVMGTTALTWSAKGVLMALLNYKRLGGATTPKIKTLGAATGLGRASVFRALAELRDAGLVAWERGRRFNTYVVPRDFHRVIQKLPQVDCEVSNRDFTGSQIETSQPSLPYIKKTTKKTNTVPVNKATSTVARKPPQTAAGRRNGADGNGLPEYRFSGGKDGANPGAVDFAPHSAESVAALRDSLGQLAREVALPAPDDAMLLRVLDAAHGADGKEIHARLVHLFRRGRFKNMNSWGLLPLIVAQWSRRAG